jgi:MraZ protein
MHYSLIEIRHLSGTGNEAIAQILPSTGNISEKIQENRRQCVEGWGGVGYIPTRDSLQSRARRLRGVHALLFVGTYEHSIDAKNRLAIPSDVREMLDGAKRGTALYAVILEGPTLCLYTQEDFEKRSLQLDESERPAEQVLLYEQMFYSLAQRLEIDKQGRVRLPERLIKLGNVNRDVVIIGVKDHLQVHDRERWEKRMEKMLSEQPDLLMNPRLVMQPGRTLQEDGSK